MRHHVIAQQARNKGSSDSRYKSADSPPVLTPAGVRNKCQEGHIASDMMFMSTLPLTRKCAWCNTC